MRALVLFAALVLALPMAAAGDAHAETDADTDCVPIFVDAIPPNEVAINPPCAAETIASVMPVGGDVVLCAFYSIWAIVSPFQHTEGNPVVIHVQGTADCVSG